MPFASSKLFVLESGKPLPEKTMAAKNVMTGYQFYFASQGFKGSFAAAWAVDTTEDEDQANMEVKYKSFPMVIETKVKDVDEASYSFSLPYLVNRKILKKDDELKLFEPKKKAPTKNLKRGLDAIAARSPQQKARR